MTREIRIGNVTLGGSNPIGLIAGPCVIESEESALTHARMLKYITQKLKVPCVFKASYDKANRTSLASFRGPGLKKGLAVLRRVKEEFGLPVLSDVHSVAEAEAAAAVLDVIQIPAFLSRQTDLLLAAAGTGKTVNIKKGQFLAPWDMGHVIKKIESTGNRSILLTERGVTFGYNTLVADFRSLLIMREYGYPVVFDATHSVQAPGGRGESSGGERKFVPNLAMAAVTCGADAIFAEVHEDPDRALSDGPNMLRMDDLEPFLLKVTRVEQAVRAYV